VSDLSKRVRENKKLVDRRKELSLEDAVAVLKKLKPAKFNETVEVSIRLGVDPKKADQVVRGTVALPHGTGKTVRVLAITKTKQSEAEAAGADLVGFEEVIEKIKGGWTDIDVIVATPEAMPEIGKLGKILGPRGLMPNPKAGTVVSANDVGRAVNEAKAGRVEFRLDKTANIHVSIGKASFDEKKLYENFAALMDAIKRARPAAAKGNYIKHITLTTTMGPGIRIDPNLAQSMEVSG